MTEHAPRHLRGVLDTSTVIMLSRITDPAALPAEPLITTLTLAELTVGPLVARTDRERAARQAHVQEAEADFEPLPFDTPAARTFGRVAASMASPSSQSPCLGRPEGTSSGRARSSAHSRLLPSDVRQRPRHWVTSPPMFQRTQDRLCDVLVNG